MCQSQSVGSYEQAGEVSHMELQLKAMKTFVEKRQAGILPTIFQDCHPGSLIRLDTDVVLSLFRSFS